MSDCDPELFETVIQMREQRLDLEDRLAEEKTAAESLKKECDAQAKKVPLPSPRLSRPISRTNLSICF